MDNNNRISDDDVWEIIKEYYKFNNVISHQLNSFNNFIDVLIPKIILQNSEIKIKNVSNNYYIVNSIPDVNEFLSDYIFSYDDISENTIIINDNEVCDTLSKILNDMNTSTSSQNKFSAFPNSIME